MGSRSRHTFVFKMDLPVFWARVHYHGSLMGGERAIERVRDLTTPTEGFNSEDVARRFFFYNMIKKVNRFNVCVANHSQIVADLAVENGFPVTFVVTDRALDYETSQSLLRVNFEGESFHPPRGSYEKIEVYIRNANEERSRWAIEAVAPALKEGGHLSVFSCPTVNLTHVHSALNRAGTLSFAAGTFLSNSREGCEEAQQLANLKCLELAFSCGTFANLEWFLGLAPNLETLKITGSLVDAHDVLRACVTKKLKSVYAWLCNTEHHDAFLECLKKFPLLERVDLPFMNPEIASRFLNSCGPLTVKFETSALVVKAALNNPNAPILLDSQATYDARNAANAARGMLAWPADGDGAFAFAVFEVLFPQRS